MLTAIVAGNEVDHAARRGRLRAASTRAASTRPRSAGSSARRCATARLTGADRRRRRARSASPARWPPASSPTSRTARRRSRSTPPGRRTAAILAVRLAALGAEGPPSVVEGKFGLYHAFLGAERGEIDIDAQLADLGSRWETPRIAYKPFPVCHFMHGSLGATAEALAGRTLAPDEIDDVLVTVPEAGVSLVLEPADEEAAAALGLRGQVLAPVLGRLDARARARRRRRTSRTRRSPTRPCWPWPRKVSYETPDVPDLPAGVPGRRPRDARRTARRSSATSRTRRAARRTRCPRTRCARSSAPTPLLALAADAARRARGARSSTSSTRTT